MLHQRRTRLKVTLNLFSIIVFRQQTSKSWLTYGNVVDSTGIVLIYFLLLGLSDFVATTAIKLIINGGWTLQEPEVNIEP